MVSKKACFRISFQKIKTLKTKILEIYDVVFILNEPTDFATNTQGKDVLKY